MNIRTLNYVLLRAIPDLVRHEVLNAGVVVFDGRNTSVLVDATAKRLPILHPDLARIDFSEWAGQIQTELRKYDLDTQVSMLSFLASPFLADKTLGQTIGNDANIQAQILFDRFVAKQKPNLPAVKRKITRHSKLQRELQTWFTDSKVYSRKIEGLSNHLVVKDYPVDVSADLYADFALRNGQLHVIETLDLRNVDHLTPTMRGEAAIKGITLNQAKELSANPIAIISASDYGIAKPAISMLNRFADDIYDLSTTDERQRLATFMSSSLNRDTLELVL